MIIFNIKIFFIWGRKLDSFSIDPAPGHSEIRKLENALELRLPIEAALGGHDLNQPDRLAAEDAESWIAGRGILQEQRGDGMGRLEDFEGQAGSEDELRRDIPAPHHDDAIGDVGWPTRARQTAEHLRAGVDDPDSVEREISQGRLRERGDPAVIETLLAEQAGTTEERQGFGH